WKNRVARRSRSRSAGRIATGTAASSALTGSVIRGLDAACRRCPRSLGFWVSSTCGPWTRVASQECPVSVCLTTSQLHAETVASISSTCMSRTARFRPATPTGRPPTGQSRSVMTFPDRGWLRFVVAVLAAWRVTHLLANEDGPADIIARVRVLLGNGFLGELADCFQCLSLWVAAPIAFLATRDRAAR